MNGFGNRFGKAGLVLMAALVSAPGYAKDVREEAREAVRNTGETPRSGKPEFSWEDCVKDRIEENKYSSEQAYKACDQQAQSEKRKNK